MEEPSVRARQPGHQTKMSIPLYHVLKCDAIKSTNRRPMAMLDKEASISKGLLAIFPVMLPLMWGRLLAGATLHWAVVACTPPGGESRPRRHQGRDGASGRRLAPNGQVVGLRDSITEIGPILSAHRTITTRLFLVGTNACSVCLA